MENKTMGMGEFDTIKLSLKEFSEAKFKLLEDIRAIQTEIKVVQQRSSRSIKKLQEGRSRYEYLVSRYDQLRSRLLELSGYQMEISSLRSRYEELTAILHARNQESESQMKCLKLKLAKQANDTAADYARQTEEKRQQLERELSALRSDLVAQDEEQILREQEREHNKEIELLHARFTMEMEQEKDTSHDNCQSKITGLKGQIKMLEEKIESLRNGM